MHPFLMQPCTRVARARCARGARCLRARGDSSQCPSPRALQIRAQAVGSFNSSFLSLSLSADSLFLSAVSHSAGFLCVSLSTTSLAERLVSSSVSASTYSLASASPCSSFGFIYFTYNGGLWTTCNFSKSYFSRTTRTRLAAPFVHSRLNHRQLVHRAKQVLDFLIAIV